MWSGPAFFGSLSPGEEEEKMLDDGEVLSFSGVFRYLTKINSGITRTGALRKQNLVSLCVGKNDRAKAEPG